LIICIKVIGNQLLALSLKGKILGLVGLGRVGSQVAKIGKAFGMEVMAWSENLNLDTCKELMFFLVVKKIISKHLIFYQSMFKEGKDIKN
jgi:D-3-phosphoglycerate dehydrogenase